MFPGSLFSCFQIQPFPTEATMWICSKCGEEHGDQFVSCWNCQTFRAASAAGSVRQGEEPNGGTAEIARTLPRTSAAPDPKLGKSVVSRYTSGYFAARGLSRIGNIVQVLGIFLFVMGAMLALAALDAPSSVGFGGYMAGVVLITSLLVGGLVFLLGVVIAAQGQLMMASLDCAVHSSPFLTDAQRAKAMRLQTD